jgi:hypothetical protein
MAASPSWRNVVASAHCCNVLQMVPVSGAADNLSQHLCALQWPASLATLGHLGFHLVNTRQIGRILPGRIVSCAKELLQLSGSKLNSPS